MILVSALEEGSWLLLLWAAVSWFCWTLYQSILLPFKHLDCRLWDLMISLRLNPDSSNAKDSHGSFGGLRRITKPWSPSSWGSTNSIRFGSQVVSSSVSYGALRLVPCSCYVSCEFDPISIKLVTIVPSSTLFSFTSACLPLWDVESICIPSVVPELSPCFFIIWITAFLSCAKA